MVVKNVMKKNIVNVSSITTITEAAKIMGKNNIGCVLVNEGDKIVGIMTERDILRSIAAGKKCEETSVKDIMTSSLITIDSEAALDHANEVMAKHKIRRLVVTKNNNIVGIITIRDVAERLKYSLAKRLTDRKEGDYTKLSYERTI